MAKLHRSGTAHETPARYRCGNPHFRRRDCLINNERGTEAPRAPVGYRFNRRRCVISRCRSRFLWVRRRRFNTFDPHMTFVFDNRPAGVQRYAGTVYDAFEKQIMAPPQLAGYTFLSSTQVRPLQAADLIAWELNRYANAILIEGLRVPAQKEILHLKAGINFDAQISNREGIIKVRDHWINYFKDKPGWLEQFANHFDFFDPSNPNYSSLSDK